MINSNKVIEIVGKALEVDSELISIESSSDNSEEWDSLAHLTILLELDRHLDGKAGKINDLATATSVRLILELLKKHDLISNE
jgi:acyl carrier protein